MTGPEPRRALHEADVDAPADFLYGLVAEATAAPLVFPQTVHVEFLERSDTAETLSIWAVDGDSARNWSSRRTIDRAGRRVTFGQVTPAPPISFMQGEWHMAPRPGGGTHVTLAHTFRAVGDDPESESSIASMVDGVSRGQLAALGRFATLAGPDGAEPLAFRHQAELAWPVADAGAFVRDAAGWAGIPPLVGPVRVAEVAPDVLVVGLTARGPDGAERAGEEARVCVGDSHVAFKATAVAAPVAAHVGCWRFTPTATGTRVAVEHRVAVDHAAGPGARAEAEAQAGAVARAVLDHMASAGPRRAGDEEAAHR